MTIEIRRVPHFSLSLREVGDVDSANSFPYLNPMNIEIRDVALEARIQK